MNKFAVCLRDIGLGLSSRVLGGNGNRTNCETLGGKDLKLSLSPKLLSIAISFFALLCVAGPHAQAQQFVEKILYSFSGVTGGDPYDIGYLATDASGNLYGTTYGGGANGYGTVFELVNSSGSYTERVLYSFTNSGGDGAYPYAGLVIDASGNLYGTTTAGGASGVGTVFELVSSSGSYSEKVLYSFSGLSGGDGASPIGGLIMDASGNLYGTTAGGGAIGYGTVFELVNFSGSYSEKVLHSFAYSGGDGLYPYAGLIMDASGNLYGTTFFGGTSSIGTVFELVNSSGSYSERVLYSFTNSGGAGGNLYAGLIMDASGNLYGTTVYGGTYGEGTVFELVNSSGSYNERVLYSFTNLGDGGKPYAGLIMDASGNLYGTTYGGGANGYGTVFELVNSSGSYTERVLYSFTNSGGDGLYPYAGLIMDASGNLYGTTFYGGTSSIGTVFELANEAAYVSVSSNLNPSAYGQPVTFTATVSGASGQVKRRSTPKGVRSQDVTGTVTWSANTGCGTSAVTSGAGTATCTTSILPTGSDTVTANYSGDSNHNPASGSISQTVNQAATAINVISVSPASEDYGLDAPVAITAVLSWTGSGSVPNAANVTIGGNGPSGYSATTCGSPSGDTITCTATYTPTTSDTVGTYTETATFSGDSNYGRSTSPQSGNFIINNASSTVLVSSSLNPSTYEDTVTFTATISGEFGEVKGRTKRSGVRSLDVTGTVTWSSNAGCGTTPVTSGNPGVATCTTSSLPAGTGTITATYSGDSNHSGGSGSLSQVVNQASSSMTVLSSLDPSTYGQAVSFTASVTGASPTGTVQFNIDGSAFGSPVTLVSGAATSGSITTLAEGTHTVTAVYSGDTNNQGSTGTLSGGQVVSQASASVSVSSSLNPSTYGQSVTLTATINGEYGLLKGRHGKPLDVTGTMTWSSNTGCGTTPVTSGNPGVATCTTSSLPVGTDTITATYSGDSNHSGGSGTLSGGQAVNQATTTTALTSSPNPSVVDQLVTFTATVTGQFGGSATGTVTFKAGAKTLGTGTLDNGAATISSALAAAGSVAITASYSGDNNNLASTSGRLKQTINKAATTTTLVSAPNPSNFGQSVIFTATVTGQFGGTPTGTVTFKNGSTTLGTGRLSGGVANFSTSSLTRGNHHITSSYGGNGNFKTSTGSLTQTVQ